MVVLEGIRVYLVQKNIERKKHAHNITHDDTYFYTKKKGEKKNIAKGVRK